MKAMRSSIYRQIVLVTALAGMWGAENDCLAQEASGSNDPNRLLNPPIVKHYILNCEYLSLDPNDPMKSHQSHGSGYVGGSSSLGTYWKDETRHFRTAIDCQTTDRQFLVQVKVTPYDDDTTTKPRTIDLDLSDLRARSVEVARNADGRVYWINMTPSIQVIDRKAVRLRESALDLTSWNLVGSPVVLDHTNYIGEMGVTGGPIASINYPLLGQVEFSLVPYKGAELAGILYDGQLRIQSNKHKHTLDIYGVRNGEPAMRLPGGPYQVWVKWPTALPDNEMSHIPSSAEEFIQTIKVQFAERGETPPNDEELRGRYEELKRGQLLSLGCGARFISASEQIE